MIIMRGKIRELFFFKVTMETDQQRKRESIALIYREGTKDLKTLANFAEYLIVNSP